MKRPPTIPPSSPIETSPSNAHNTPCTTRDRGTRRHRSTFEEDEPC